MELSSTPFTSVIIPVFNDAEHLKVCLAALEQQTYPKHLYEVIVVDNASDGAEKIEAIVNQFGQAIAAYEATPGSYAARNTGIALARGEVIAFTDADCIPAIDWLEKGVTNLVKIPGCGLVAGRINIFFKDPNQATLIELYESVFAFPQQYFLDRYRGCATANLFTWRRVMEQVGLFNPNIKSGGDLEWGHRVYALGYQQIYADDACIAHPARSSFVQLHKKFIRIAGGVYDLYVKQAHPFQTKIKTLLRVILDDLLRALESISYTFQYSDLEASRQKFGVSLIILLVGYISILEKIRLQFGGVSSRG